MTIWGDLKEFSMNFVKYFLCNYTQLYIIYTQFIQNLYTILSIYTLFYTQLYIILSISTLFLHYLYSIYTVFIQYLNKIIHYLDTIYFHQYVTCTGVLP